ncbi:MAG: metalloregulator ArsR/SmtB family transcription factor [Propionibacteriaceae bacterium]|nr:metalloregulator ArsR/SmtB family transcription factor [Propionibacteriaceae bacterium]
MTVIQETPLSECCPSSLVLMDPDEADELAVVLKAVADPVRLRLLHYIAAAPDTTVCACHLPAALGITQPTLSHHLKRLADARLITREQRGKWAHYRLNTPVAERLIRALQGAVA